MEKHQHEFLVLLILFVFLMEEAPAKDEFVVDCQRLPVILTIYDERNPYLTLPLPTATHKKNQEDRNVKSNRLLIS